LTHSESPEWLEQLVAEAEVTSRGLDLLFLMYVRLCPSFHITDVTYRMAICFGAKIQQLGI